MNIKLNTASKTITPVLLLRNQMKNADTDDKAIEMPEKYRVLLFKGDKLVYLMSFF